MSRSNLNPQPRAWPRCSECKTAYVLRLALMFDSRTRTMSSEWMWQRDCKHRKAEPEVAGAPSSTTKRKPSPNKASRSGR